MGLTSTIAAAADFQLLESMLWTPDDGYFLLDRHMRRLHEAAAYFGFAVSTTVVADEAMSYARQLPKHPHKIRLLVSRSGQSQWDAALIIPSTGRESRPVALLPDALDTSTPFFRFKTSHRPHYDQALAAFPDCADVLLCNLRGELTESCRANLVLERNGLFLTPPLTSGLLDGTFRADLLARGEIQEHVLYPTDLHSADRVFLINSVRKWMPVQLTVTFTSISPSHLKA